MAQIPLYLILSIIIIRAIIKVAAGRIEQCLVSLLSAILYVVCLVIPVHLQSSGLLVSKLELGQFLPFPYIQEINTLSLSWAAELTVILLGELASNVLRLPSLYSFPELKSVMSPVIEQGNRPAVRRVANVLLVIGLIAALAFSTSIEHRADSGQGLSTVLRSFFVVGICLIAYNKFFSRTAYYVVGGVAIVVLIAAKVRNPLLFVLIAYIAGMISRRELRLRKSVYLIIAAGLLGIAGAWMSAMRGSAIRHQGVSPLIALETTLRDPFSALYGSGIDTLDGYRFSMLLSPSFPADPSNLLIIVTNFVPRAIWPDKPTDITNMIGQKYLNYESSGMFLSPVGHLTVVFGGYGFALVGMFLFGFIFTGLIRRNLNSFVLSVILLVVIDYLLAGGFFPLYQGLAQLLPLFASTMLVRVVPGTTISQPVTP
jgi:hypothetical protein